MASDATVQYLNDTLSLCKLRDQVEVIRGELITARNTADRNFMRDRVFEVEYKCRLLSERMSSIIDQMAAM